MKKLLTALILLLILSNAWAQKNDTIISSTKGTIICKIKSIENNNIYYYQGDAYKFIAMKDVNYFSGHGKVDHNFDGKHQPEWHYKPDTNKYLELVCVSHVNILGSMIGGDPNVAQRFEILVNPYSDSISNKSLTPFIYPLDAINFFAKKGYSLKFIFSTYSGSGKDIEIRHYILEH